MNAPCAGGDFKKVGRIGIYPPLLYLFQALTAYDLLLTKVHDYVVKTIGLQK